jgi:hypothetical protein
MAVQRTCNPRKIPYSEDDTNGVRRKSGGKHQLLTEPIALPLKAPLTAARVNEVTRWTIKFAVGDKLGLKNEPLKLAATQFSSRGRSFRLTNTIPRAWLGQLRLSFGRLIDDNQHETVLVALFHSNWTSTD